MSVYKFGHVKSEEKSSDFLWADFRQSIKRQLDQINIPLTFGHGNTYTDWNMLANGPDPTAPGKAKDGVGCCEIAAGANETKISLTDAGAPIVPTGALFNGATTVADYSAIGSMNGGKGYDPKTGENDNGLETRARLEYQQKTGLIDVNGKRHKIGPYWRLEPGNLQHILECLLFSEALPIGMVVCQAQMDQFNEGERSGKTVVWDHVPGSPEEGGHCIPECGRPDSVHIAAITWRRRIFLTPSLISNQVDEIWGYATPERINATTGKTYEGATEAQVEEYLTVAANKLVKRFG